MTKRPYQNGTAPRESGQISIFFASSLIVLISIIAFVINIGLFVKAKINLQNAVDAAAYAGAAVQARMLNRIGYMNWEMRNNYKEWMFKYYVLGNLNIKDVVDPPPGSMNFGMEPDPNGGDQDIYNFPSVCIHYAGVPTNICRRYAIPGIPRFEPTNLVGIDETTSTFIDAIVKEKAADCSKRTQLNFNVTNLWAYNLTDGAANNAFVDAPQIAADRIGAWPRGVELAIRTRSLEYAMNRPPVTEGICSPNGDGAAGCTPIRVLENEKHFGNERPIKAFWSAYRNIGNENDAEMKATFTLTELSPTGVEIGVTNSLSTMLMSPDSSKEKFYVDLKLELINYATFFTALISRDDRLNAGGQNVKAEGACDVSKIAIPVPGFPLGFYKNPEVLTYYAVKGEARFQGLFNPFSSEVKLTAYAAAKPMGGRIGPALFRPKSETTLASRSTPTKKRSTSYLSGIDLTNLPKKGTPGVTVPLGQYAPGMPIPINTSTDPQGRFWIKDSDDEVGGWVNGPGIVFGIPNLVYDFENNSPNANNYVNQSVDTNIIFPNGDKNVYASGLFKSWQFKKFKENLVNTDTPAAIAQSITNVRAPTAYEAANYTIPTPNDLNINEQVDGAYLDTFGFVNGAEEDGRRTFRMYAPLYGPTGDAMYKNAQEVVTAIKVFMLAQEPAMKKYRDSMNRVAKVIYDDDPIKYKEAAERISNFGFNKLPDAPDANPGCKSIAGTFLWFYFGGAKFTQSEPGCPLPLTESIESYFTRNDSVFTPSSHTMEFSYQEEHPANLIKFPGMLTGYMPGPLRGATPTGLFSSPFPSTGFQESMRRTGYSAKLITLNSVSSGGYAPGATAPFATYSEGESTPLANDINAPTLRNRLDTQGNGVPSTINH